jgi:hypothetical protein
MDWPVPDQLRQDGRTPEVVFLTGGCGVIDQCGLAYRPGSRATGRRYSHVHGDWYLLYDRF